MIRILCISAIIFAIGCVYAAERRDVEIESGYVGKEVSTHKPTVFIKNLPHEDNVPVYISRNTATLFASEATKRLDRVPNTCGNCLSPELMVQPIRVEYVPTGTKFTVIGEFLRFKSWFPFSDSKIHFLLLLGEDGEISEFFRFPFEEFFEPDKYGGLGREDIGDITRDLQKFEKKGSLIITYCPNLKIAKKQNVENFIKDFSLENEVQIETNYELCEEGIKLVFLVKRAT